MTLPLKDSSGHVIVSPSDLDKLSVQELMWENMRLGELPEYAHPEIVALRIEINRVRDLKLAEVHRELRRKEESGEFPPGQVLKLGGYQAKVYPLQK